MVSAEQIAFIAFTATAACILSPNMVKKRANSWNTGFPGGCPTSSLYEEAMNSPQSQKEAVGSMVNRYVTAAITNTAAAVSLFHNVNFLLSINFYYFVLQVIVIFAISGQIYAYNHYICKNKFSSRWLTTTGRKDLE